ncbi:cytochrome B [Pseudooceanicola sediminis]|mgnify:CR=1 FL=1|uniref:Cytochrome B n=1 Tax=Pseudooceanicola sediminis TaxID=2211117 RepID=A0A399IW82_9RHOB|nr:cytochrome b/b6 domain-containing protein [Pseudooceanicola sediminis]KAA2312344.1 cytochrome B [Puniceibacterium sp. HSS470]RII37395.1 cytochrome B [Pseudooceanicola sediminis]|tara:strand:- start:13906 stop:14403 length:498 start_codon:yes stop_codon:yes gene_type:complete
MQHSRKPSNYSRLQIYLHWAVVLLIAFQFLFSDGMSRAFHQVMDGSAGAAGLAATSHIVVGLSVLALTLVRLVLRATRGAPAHPEGETPLMRLVARLTHWGIYALLVLVPLSGMAAWFGRIGPAASAHEVLKTVLLILVLLHIAAALFHQFVLRTNLIARMNPHA